MSIVDQYRESEDLERDALAWLVSEADAHDLGPDLVRRLAQWWALHASVEEIATWVLDAIGDHVGDHLDGDPDGWQIPGQMVDDLVGRFEASEEFDDAVDLFRDSLMLGADD